MDDAGFSWMLMNFDGFEWMLMDLLMDLNGC